MEYAWVNTSSKAKLNAVGGELQYISDTAEGAVDTVVVAINEEGERSIFYDTTYVTSGLNGELISINFRYSTQGGVTTDKNWQAGLGLYKAGNWENVTWQKQSSSLDDSMFVTHSGDISPIVLNMGGNNTPVNGYGAIGSFDLDFSNDIDSVTDQRMLSTGFGLFSGPDDLEYRFKDIPTSFQANGYDVILYFSLFRTNSDFTQRYSINGVQQTITSQDTIFDGEYRIYSGITSDSLWVINDGPAQRKMLSGMQIFSPVRSSELTVVDTQSIASLSYTGELLIGDSIIMEVETSSKGLPITYQLDDPTAGTIIGNKIIWLKTGTFTIMASQDGNETTAAAFDQILSVEINKDTQSIAQITFSGDLELSKSIVLSPSTSSKGLDITFSLSDPSAGSIVGNTLTWLKDGSFEIYANQSGNDFIEAAIPDTLEVMVLGPLQVQPKNQNNLSIYPNPFHDQLQINGYKGEVVRLLDASGKVVIEQIISTSLFRVDVGSLKQGVYTAHYGNESKVLIKR